MHFFYGIISGLILGAGAALVWGAGWKARALAAEAEIKAAAAHAKASAVKLGSAVSGDAKGALQYIADRLTYFGERL